MNCPKCGDECVQLSVMFCRRCSVGWVQRGLEARVPTALKPDTMEGERVLLERCFRLPSHIKP